MLIFSAIPQFVIAQNLGSDDPLAQLHGAIERVQAHSEQRYAFTVDYWSSDGEEEFSMTARYDPRRAEGERWEAIKPTADELPKKALKAFKQLEKIERPDERFLYDDLDEAIGGIEFAEETDTALVFKGPLLIDDLPEDALEAQITVNKAGGFISRIEATSIKPFKPVAVAKVKSMRLVQLYSLPQDGPALLTQSESDVSGSAMFKSFKAQSQEVYSDIQPVDVPAIEIEE